MKKRGGYVRLACSPRGATRITMLMQPKRINATALGLFTAVMPDVSRSKSVSILTNSILCVDRILRPNWPVSSSSSIGVPIAVDG